MEIGHVLNSHKRAEAVENGIQIKIEGSDFKVK